MMSLLSFSLKGRHYKRALNVDAMVNMFIWLASRRDIGVDPARIAFAGHSAGSGIITEAACKLLKRNESDIKSSNIEPTPYPRALLLLDGVPWKTTIDKGSDATLNIIVRDPTIRNSQTPPPTVVCSIRGEPSSWNADGLILQLLTRGLGRATATYGSIGSTVTDIKVNSAKHLDFACTVDKGQHVSGLIVNPISKFFYKMFNLISNDEVQVVIQDLAVSFLVSELVEGGGGTGAVQGKVNSEFSVEADSFDRAVKLLASGGLITAVEVGKDNVTELVAYNSYLL